MSTVGAVVDRLYREWLLPADQQPTIARLGTSLDDSTTSLSLDARTLAPDEQYAIGPGAVLEVGLEWMLVIEWTNDTAAGTVLRGYAGTTAAAHADEALVTVSPSFARVAAFEAVCDEVVSLHPALWGYDTTTVTAADEPIEVDADVVGIASVMWVGSDSRLRAGGATLIRYYPSVTSGRAVQTTNVPKGKTTYLVLRKEFARPTAESDTLADLLIDDSWVGILVAGAAARMAMYIDPSRLHLNWATEFDANELAPPGTGSSLGLRLRALRDSLLDEASKRQQQEYPVTIKYSSPFRPESRT